MINELYYSSGNYSKLYFFKENKLTKVNMPNASRERQIVILSVKKIN